ncbi:MAG: hypothetical protein ISS74_07405 [Planctomycetes bacterium]|nr:hypothetical protein [Planctomycetota bacterium]
MAQFDEGTLRKNLEALAAPAKSDLAWLAAYHIFFKTSQQHAPASASSVLTIPEQSIRVPVEQFPSPEKARCAWEQAVQAFHDLRRCALNEARDNPGHYLNKAALVYAVAVVEGFLSDAYKAGWQAAYPNHDLINRIPASVRPLVGILGHLKDRNGKPYPGCYNKKYPENTLLWARDALFLAEIRHAVVHRQGKVDCKFEEAVGWKGNGDPIWDDAIWPTPQAFERDFINPPDRKDPNQPVQVCLDLTKVVIPYMPKCVAFIDASIGQLIAAAKNWPDGP